MLTKTKSIKSKLVLLGIKQKRIADEMGVSRSFVSRVLDGKRTSRRVESYILNLIKEEG